MSREVLKKEEVLYQLHELVRLADLIEKAVIRLCQQEINARILRLEGKIDRIDSILLTNHGNNTEKSSQKTNDKLAV